MERLLRQTLIIFAILLVLASSASAFEYTILSSNPAPTQAGEYADVTIRIDTQGISSNQLQSFTLSVDETDFIKPVPGQEKTFRALSPGQTITTTFRVYLSPTIPTGAIPFTLLLAQEQSTIELTEQLYVSGASNRAELYIGQVRSTPNNLLQDTDANTLDVIVQNLGEKEAQLLSAELLVDESIISESYSYSLQDIIASIPGGEQETFSFVFDIEKTPLLAIPAELSLRYRTQNDFDNSYDVIEENIPFTIRLTSAPRYEIINIEEQNTLQAGTTANRIKLTIENTGEEEARSVRVRLYPDPAVPFDFEKTSVFIASNIKPGEQASVLIPFDILEEALTQEYSINIELESLVGATRYVQDERLTIIVEEEASSGLTTYLIVLIVVSLLIAAIIGFVYNRKKK